MSHSAYIIQDNSNTLYSFYYMNGSIYIRHFTNNIWSRAENLVSDIRPNYSISQSSSLLYLICQEIKGNILLYTFKNQVWSRKILLESVALNSPDIYMASIIKNDSLSLIYNLPDNKNKTQNIVLHQQLGNGQWNSPKILDNISPGTTFFKLINNKYLFYIKNKVLYMQNIENQQETIKLYTGNIIDYSAVFFNDAPHISLIAKTRIGIQLIYIHNQKSNVLWEGNKGSFTAINLIDNKIILYFVTGNRLYNIINPVENKELTVIGADNYIKAQYTSAQGNSSLCDIIINSNRPSDLYFVKKENTYSSENKLKKLQQDINNMTNELNKKNSAINQLYNYKVRNEELIQENANLRQRYKELLEKYKSKDNQKQLPAIIKDDN